MLLFDEMPVRTLADAPAEFPDLSRARTFETRRSILALDLGTKLGWATVDRHGVVRSGSVNCTTRGAKAHSGRRWSTFRAHLSELTTGGYEIDAVYFEEVMAHGKKGQPNTVAAHVYGGFLAHLEHWCYGRNIEPIGISVSTVKKAWAGHGHASKEQMIATAEAKGFRPADDNEADALAILSLAITRENAQ